MAAASCCKRASRREKLWRERCSVYYGMSNMAWALLELPGWDSNERIGSYLEGRRCSGLVYSPDTRGRLRERPDPHALPPAPLAVGYLCVPADAQFIKALMRGLLPAIWAKAAEPFGTVAQMN